jgi:pseudouridine-5'-phosphate glycosidase
MKEKIIMIKDSLKGKIRLSLEVEEALKQNRPIVALESTIISHGMPFPQNVETANMLEELARKKGVTPATIAILDGIIHIGLDEKQKNFLGQSDDILKVSRSDFAYCLAHKKNGATTVSATMIAASLAGIKIFATGGIGGVHRDAETTFDISADLLEFTKTPVLVVSAGAKAILDIPKTLEYLETCGVPVIGYQTDLFPAFYSRTSSNKLRLRHDSAKEIASTLSESFKLGFESGILVANPIPEEFEIPHDVIEAHIEKALKEMNEKGVSGKEVTPFLLSRIVELTKGESLKTNIALVKNNVELASDIALCYY